MAVACNSSMWESLAGDWCQEFKASLGHKVQETLTDKHKKKAKGSNLA